MNCLKPFRFIFFILFIFFSMAYGSWEDTWGTENLSDIDSIDSGDIEAEDTSGEAGDISAEEGDGSRKNIIEKSAKARTKEALKGFLDDAFGGDE